MHCRGVAWLLHALWWFFLTMAAMFTSGNDCIQS